MDDDAFWNLCDGANAVLLVLTIALLAAGY